MKIAFRPKLHLSKKNIVQLNIVNNIIEEYRKMGYRLTLRQLYYQLVSRDVIPNNDREYAKISDLLVKGRMGGVVDWDAIEDRVRVPNLPYQVDDIDDAIEDTINSYRLDRQLGQPNYIELWVEKDALSSVLKRKTHHYHVRLMVNRGYSSCTAMYDAFNRFKHFCEKDDRKGHILYLGDHDPSGLDMIRDISERLEEFGVELTVTQIGLTTKQVKQYNPPPNPAKITDPRAKWYIEKYGPTSWEVDALNPVTLHEIIDANIVKLLDMKKFNAMVAKEAEEKEEISKLPHQRDKIMKLEEFLIKEIEPLKTKSSRESELVEATYNKILKMIQ